MSIDHDTRDVWRLQKPRSLPCKTRGFATEVLERESHEVVLLLRVADGARMRTTPMLTQINPADQRGAQLVRPCEWISLALSFSLSCTPPTWHRAKSQNKTERHC